MGPPRRKAGLSYVHDSFLKLRVLEAGRLADDWTGPLDNSMPVSPVSTHLVDFDPIPT